MAESSDSAIARPAVAGHEHRTSSPHVGSRHGDSQAVLPSSQAGAEVGPPAQTRSRNRARPNYSEEQFDLDLELSAAAGSNSKKSLLGSPATIAGPSSATSFVAINRNVSAMATSAKEAAPSKKRKAVGAPASNLHPPGMVNTPPPMASRKPGISASSSAARESNVMTFTKYKSCLNKKGQLVADDGTVLNVNDHVYLVCEPPGEPYYMCRVMQFLHTDADNPSSPVDSIRVNWYYRPRDVLRSISDTRLVYATMHSDMCPLTSLRGKCNIMHRSEISDLDAYRKEQDSFYFVQVFDRFIRRWYECIPVREIINVPYKVKKALDERWKFVVVEIGRVKELTSAAKSCKRCARYAASSDSVDCAICKNSYHMNCVQPPLPKKPSRGFAWACGPCSRASEKKYEARDTPTISGNATEADEEEAVEEGETRAASNDTTRAPSPTSDEMVIDQHPATQAEIALAKMWPMRYLGIHARLEDALQYDDRAIYPRASSRLGPRHQANTNIWHGRPVELIKPAEIKKRYNKGNAQKKDGKLSKETVAAMEADREERAKRPKWVQDEPSGYVPRGEDFDSKDPRCTAKLLFKMPDIAERPEDGPKYQEAIRRNEHFVDDYLSRAKRQAKSVGVPPFGANYIDKAFELLTANKYNVDATLKQLGKVDRVKDLHEPVLTKSELVKFEEGVAKHGSEHRSIRLHMKTILPHADIVRFYYLWKKTPKGREIWGNFGGRKKRKLESEVGGKLQAEVANDADDSAFDNDKAARRNQSFQCKFCNTTHCRQWRRAPGGASGQTTLSAKDGKEKSLLALCLRCAGLWRKYAIQWEDVDEVAKKVAQGGGRAVKRRVDEELLRELRAANDAASVAAQEQAASSSVDNAEPPKKKSRMDREAALAAIEAQKKKEKPAPPPPPPPKEPTPPPPPIIPNQPTWKDLPCAICKGFEDTVACQHCKLTVHRQCFGLRQNEGVRGDGEVKWVCEQCQNDRNPTVSTDYSCCLCLTEETLVDLVEPPRVSHKKKTDRDREKERMEKELADAMRADYRSKQLSQNRSPIPREPLKRTTGNNWVHIHCAVWAPEIRFSNAKAMEVAEGFQLIPQPRFEAICKLCKNKDHQNRVRENAGACVSCFQCNANFHASCAFEAGYTFGFDVQPVKGSRKDQVTTATLGQETGHLTPVIFCKEHVVTSIVHPVNEILDDDGTTALQVFTQNYRQADLTLTGTVRKANLAQLTKEKGQQAISKVQNDRRESGAHSIAAAVKRGARTSSVADTKADVDDGTTDLGSVADGTLARHCAKCDVDVTPKWHLIVKDQASDRPKSSDHSLVVSIRDPTEPEPMRNPGNNQLPEHQTTDSAAAHPGEPTHQPNTRFMAPGANGHAWDGMNDRPEPRSIMNEEPQSSDGPPNGVRLSDGSSPSDSNGAHLHSANEPARQNTDDGYHAHALPRFQNPAEAIPLTADVKESKEVTVPEYLCHKCFLKKKLDPTPPPEERPSSRPALSPPHQFPLQLEFNRDSQPPQTLTIDQQFRLWDEPPPPPPAPAPPVQAPPPADHSVPHVNGVGPSHPGPPHAGPSHPGAPHPGASHAGAPHPGAPHTGPPHSGAPHPGYEGYVPPHLAPPYHVYQPPQPHYNQQPNGHHMPQPSLPPQEAPPASQYGSHHEGGPAPQYGQPHDGARPTQYGPGHDGHPVHQYAQAHDGPPPAHYGPPHDGPPPSQYGPPHDGPPPSQYGPHDGPPPPQYGPAHDRPPTHHYGPGPPMHERHHSYGYPQPSPAPPQYMHQGPYAPPAMNGYPPPPQHHGTMPNGAPSSHPGPVPAMQSPPSYPPPPSQHSTISPYAQQLPPIGGPAHSSPDAPFGRPRQESMNGQPPQQQGPPPAAPAMASPYAGSVGSDGQAQRPTTPHGGQMNGTPGPGVGGASASPSLNYLIH